MLMKKILIISSIFLSCAINLFAQNNFTPNGIYRDSTRGWCAIFEFRTNKTVEKTDYYSNDQENEKKLKGIFNIEYKNKIPFLNILWEDKTSEYFLMLGANDFFCLYKADSAKPYLTLYKHRQKYYDDFSEWSFRYILNYAESTTASSSLTEGDKTYSPENLTAEINTVWSEGVVGDGIHEILSVIKDMQVDTIYISIGYVSYLKPNLYTENSRPKKIKITRGDSYSQEVDLIDTPNYQAITIPSWLDNLQIEILDIYKGTKYEDTCINSILYKLEGN
jgi:hypothetical protein